MKWSNWYLFPLLFLVMACGSQQTVKDEAEQPAVVEEPAVAAVEPVSSPGIKSLADQEADKQEVQIFIKNLNETIRRKDYEAWKAALSPEYFAEIASPEFLAEKSNQRAMKMQKIVLKTPRDYFDKVVVPSRSSSRVEVDNIELEYITQTRVKVFPVSAEGVVQQDRRLYELQHTENGWTIIN